MPEEFTFIRNTGSYGYRVLDRQGEHQLRRRPVPRAVLQVGCRVPGNRPGIGGGIPGFASRDWAARFLYRYRKPQPSGRT